MKEACVVDITTNSILLHHIAKPPCARDFLSPNKQRESYWVTKHWHGLEWDQGDIKYNTLLDELRTCLQHRSIIYVKGLEKKKFVLQFLVKNDTMDVIDTLEIGCPALNKTSEPSANTVLRCDQHKSAWHKCALANCSLLRAWLNHYFEEGEYKRTIPCAHYNGSNGYYKN